MTENLLIISMTCSDHCWLKDLASCFRETSIALPIINVQSGIIPLKAYIINQSHDIDQFTTVFRHLLCSLFLAREKLEICHLIFLTISQSTIQFCSSQYDFYVHTCNVNCSCFVAYARHLRTERKCTMPTRYKIPSRLIFIKIEKHNF